MERLSPDVMRVMLQLPAGQSLPFSCREGMCRSCEIPLVSGEADHRDYVLSDEERAAHQCILPCVSRARSAELVLDL